MPNLSQKKRDRMLTFLKMLKDENKTSAQNYHFPCLFL